ncbi:unnamed protein product [Caenorhabditis sp. 36 PRJEB53466]|nr:unnamed protein product [Caenorhabditis sp. 36 PRJEB53466]
MISFAAAFSVAHSTIAILGMTFNVLLIYLALCKSPKAIHSYATLIVNFAVTDFCACLFDFFVQQRIIPAGRTLAYISSGMCEWAGTVTCYTLYSLMLHFLAHTLWSLLLSFSYRYYILFKPSPSRKTLLLILLIIYQPSMIQWVSFLYAQSDPQEIVEILRDRFPEYNTTGLCVYGTKDIGTFAALYTIFHMTVPITPVYICILILRRKIIKKLSFQNVNIAKDTKNLHTQFLISLTYQAALPGFFFFSIVSYALGQLSIVNSPVLEYFTSSGFLLIPFFSPLASFIFVSPYRNFIRKTVFRVAPDDSSATPNQIVTSIHMLG